MRMVEGLLTMRRQVNYSNALADLMLNATQKKSQRQIARDAEVSQGTVGNMVLGRVPSREVCLAVAEASGIDPIVMLSAAGYEVDQDPLQTIRLALRGTRALSNASKQEILEFTRERIAEDEKIQEQRPDRERDVG